MTSIPWKVREAAEEATRGCVRPFSGRHGNHHSGRIDGMTELTPEMIPAFNAAYVALGPYTQHATIRDAVAAEIATELWDLRSQHGMGLMLQVADSQEMRTRHVSGFVASFRAQGITAVGLAATDKAVQAAAKVLAAG